MKIRKETTTKDQSIPFTARQESRYVEKIGESIQDTNSQFGVSYSNFMPSDRLSQFSIKV